VVEDFFLRLTLSTRKEEMIDDRIPDKNYFSILVFSRWFSDINNYLVVGRFPPNLSSTEKRKIVRESSPFSWIGGNLFILGID